MIEYYNIEQDACPSCGGDECQITIATNEARDSFIQLAACLDCEYQWTQPLSDKTIRNLVAIAKQQGNAHQLPPAWLKIASGQD